MLQPCYSLFHPRNHTYNQGVFKATIIKIFPKNNAWAQSLFPADKEMLAYNFTAKGAADFNLLMFNFACRIQQETHYWNSYRKYISIQQQSSENCWSLMACNNNIFWKMSKDINRTLQRIFQNTPNSFFHNTKTSLQILWFWPICLHTCRSRTVHRGFHYRLYMHWNYAHQPARQNGSQALWKSWRPRNHLSMASV